VTGRRRAPPPAARVQEVSSLARPAGSLPILLRDSHQNPDRRSISPTLVLRADGLTGGAPSRFGGMMNTKKTLLLAALLTFPLFAFKLPGTRVKFAPAQGSSAIKTFEYKAEFSLDNMSVTLNGQEAPTMPEMDMTMTNNQKVVVTDEYVALREGAPKKLRRRFDEITNAMAVSMKMEMMGQSQSSDNNVNAKSDLLGKQVVFTWDEDAKEYKKAFDPAEDNAALLEGLQEDMDLRVLLPQGEVAEGDEWDIDVKELGRVLAPGGNLSLVPEEAGKSQVGMGDMSGMGSLSDWLGELIEGSAKGSLVSVRKQDDAQIATIKLNFKINGSKDMSEMVSQAMEKAELPPGAGEIKVEHMDLDFRMEGEGELIWNLTAGRLQTFELSGPMRVNIDMAMKMSVQGQEMSIGQAMEMSGTSTMNARAE
jgi:hypothetical protein